MSDFETRENAIHMRRESDRVRLDSWKAIASYLNRSVRTVRRWETNEDLPVLRHQHRKGSSVYAYEAELDAWRSNHQVSHVKVSNSTSLDISARNGKEKLLRYAAVLLLGIAIVGVADLFDVTDSMAKFNDDSSTVSSSQDGVVAYSPEDVAQMLVAPMLSDWKQGRIPEAFRESQNIVQHLPDYPVGVRENVSAHLVEFFVTLGRVADARLVAEGLTDDGVKTRLTDYILFAAGDMKKVRSVLEAAGDGGDSSAARLAVLAAMTAMQEGHIADAKTQLEVATGELDIADRGYYFVALDLLAHALRSEGNLTDAISVLELTMPKRELASNNKSGIFWLICQKNLADFYRNSGRESDAVHLENELRHWLQFADEDFPIARYLGAA